MVSKSNQVHSRIILLTVGAALAIATPLSAQSTASNSSSTNAAKDQEGGYSLVDASAFFGTQWYQIFQGSTGGGNQFFQPKPVTGGRVTENFSRYVSLEEAYTIGYNRLAILPSGGSTYATIGSNNQMISVVGVLNMTPRDSRFRPYFLVGPGGIRYAASLGQAYSGITQPPPSAVQATGVPFRTEEYVALVYGVGAKVNLNRRVAFTYDLRGVLSKTADFGLPEFSTGPGSLFVTHNHGESSLALTVGVVLRLGYHEPPAPPPPPRPPPPPPPPPVANIQVGAIQGAQANVCPGDNVRLSVTASGWLPDQTPTYTWTVNNQPAPGGTGAAFNLPTTTPGAKAVRVTVSAGQSMATSGPVNVTVRALTQPTVQFSVSPTTIAYGDRLPLNAMATVSQPCATPTPIRYTASEGTIAGTAFDSSTLTFDPNGAGVQQKQVTLTATETDSRNQTGTATANVTVTFKRPAERTDIVFPNRSSRVNNAAKRYLIEVLTPKLRADPNSTVILIGHRDMSETGRAAATLDTQRVLNTAAVLSAGKGICPSLDLSRIQVTYAGADQTDAPMPFGDNSVKERRGAAATDARAQFRRVEVWFIPGGSDRPNVPGLQPAPAREIQAKGCPR